LLALDPRANFSIVVVSANANQYFPPAATAEDLFGLNITTLLGSSYGNEIRGRLLSGSLRGAAPWKFTLFRPGATALDVAVHAHAGIVLAEVKFYRHVADPLRTGRQLEEFLGELNEARNDLLKLAKCAVAGIRAITDYERGASSNHSSPPSRSAKGLASDSRWFMALLNNPMGTLEF
jgi:light-regulated signal transduction histidine kinase (bacteriophytochrome)